MELPLKVLQPATRHTHTVVFLHGRGGNAQSLIRSLGDLRDSKGWALLDIFPSFRWVFPQAPARPCVSSAGQTTATQWFDIWSVADFSDHEDQQAPGLRDSVVGLRAVLAREAATLGGRWDRLVLAGISQGAATGVHALLNLPVDGRESLGGDGGSGSGSGSGGLGAFLGFSCRMPFPGRTLAETRAVLALGGGSGGGDSDDEVIRNTPVLLEHCVDDPLVLVGGGRELRDTLRGFGAQVSWKEYPEGGHWFNSPSGVDDAVQFLVSALGLPRSSTYSTG